MTDLPAAEVHRRWQTQIVECARLRNENATIRAQLQIAADARNVVAPVEPTETMIDAALAATNGRLNIAGSSLTVNREKMRIRYRAMIAALKPARTEGE